MNKVTAWIKEKKKILTVVALIILLVLIVFIFFGDGSDKSTSAYYDVEKSQTELKLTALLESMDGVGQAEVMVTETDGEIIGVVIVCEGADRIMVINDILNAVSTALNINKNIIAVYSM